LIYYATVRRTAIIPARSYNWQLFQWLSSIVL